MANIEGFSIYDSESLISRRVRVFGEVVEDYTRETHEEWLKRASGILKEGLKDLVPTDEEDNVCN